MRLRAVKPPWEQKGLVPRPATKSVRALANQIFEGIAAGSYPNGTRLPAERQLAEEFRLSRNTVRHALEFLESYDIIVRRPGSGSFVTYQETSTEFFPDDPAGQGAVRLPEIAEITSPLELNVVRSIVEPEIIRLAVINMAARDIEKLRHCLTELETVRTSAEDFSHWDMEFHLQVARGTHNPLLISIYELVDHVRRHAHWAKTKEKTLSPNRIRDYQAKHRSIYEAIEARDIESAVEYSKLHMTEVQRDLMRDT